MIKQIFLTNLKFKIMSNLSEQLQAKTTAFKTAMDDAKTANQVELEQRLSAAKGKAETKQAELTDALDAQKSKFKENLDVLKSKMASKKATIIEKLDEKKAEHKAKIAERQAEHAEENAKEMMAWAFYYIDEAQIAVLEALVARIKAEALKN